MTTTFGKLAIGDTFHIGKSKGIGAQSDVVKWEKIKKISKSQGRVIEAFGGFHTKGHLRAFSPSSYAFKIV